MREDSSSIMYLKIYWISYKSGLEKVDIKVRESGLIVVVVVVVLLLTRYELI